MNFKKIYLRLLLSIFLLAGATPLLAQTTTVVTGTVTDASNRQALPYVTVSFSGSSIGGQTDANGKYHISTTQNLDHIRVSFVGYKDATLTIEPGKTQVINVKLFPEAQQLTQVNVKAGKKEKYRNKGNPAVELIRQVIAHRPLNRPESYPYVEYKEYDKMMFSLVNVSPTLGDKKFFHKYMYL